MYVPIALGAAALWVFYRKRLGLPILPHLGPVPHIPVLTPAGPALVPATTQVIPVSSLSPTAALSLAQAASQTAIDPGIHAPRYITGSGYGAASQGALGQFVGQTTTEHPILSHHNNPALAFDILSHDSMPRGQHIDEFGILRSSLSRPFGVR
jgi:hypothetical protein